MRAQYSKRKRRKVLRYQHSRGIRIITCMPKLGIPRESQELFASPRKQEIYSGERKIDRLMTNLDTGLARTINTSGDGQYVVPDLRIGRYTVRAAAAGFKTTEQQNITLQVGDRARVDLKLAVGSAQEQVTVEAAAIAVQADTGEISDVISGQKLTQLSTNGRSIY